MTLDLTNEEVDRLLTLFACYVRLIDGVKDTLPSIEQKFYEIERTIATEFSEKVAEQLLK